MGNQFTKKELRRINWRWMLYGQICLNYASLQGGGYLTAITPALEKLYGNNKEDLKRALVAHNVLYNSTPHMAHMVLGLDLAIEEKEGIDSIDTVAALKAALMGPVSGIGDTIFAIMNSVIFGAIAATMAVEGNPLGMILWEVWYFFVIFGLRPIFFNIGYSQGKNAIEKMSTEFKGLTSAVSKLGLIVVGSMIPSMVKMNFATFKIGTSELNLGTDFFNKIIPGLPQMLLTIALFVLISKTKITTTKLVLVLIVFSVIMSYFGIMVP